MKSTSYADIPELNGPNAPLGVTIPSTIAAVPEPATVALMFTASIPLTWRRRKVGDGGVAMAHRRIRRGR